MKKHLILLLVAGLFAFSSCSDDDDNAGAEASIVATWNLTSINPPVLNLDECSEKPTITFNANGTADWTLYDADNDCTAVEASGTWEKNSATEYSVSVPGFESFDGTVDFKNQNEFTFLTSIQGVPVTFTFQK